VEKENIAPYENRRHAEAYFMDPRIKVVTKYRTTDEKEFSHPDWADEHQLNVDRAEKATELLNAGNSILAALSESGLREAEHIPELMAKVTKDSKLVISYWQCRDTPGYSPNRIRHDGLIYCYGNAGSWSGPYGGWVPLQDLERYAKDEQTIL
jgi:hypothetical protein